MLNLEGIRGKRIKSTKFYFFVKIQLMNIIFHLFVWLTLNYIY